MKQAPRNDLFIGLPMLYIFERKDLCVLNWTKHVEDINNYTARLYFTLCSFSLSLLTIFSDFKISPRVQTDL